MKEKKYWLREGWGMVLYEELEKPPSLLSSSISSTYTYLRALNGKEKGGAFVAPRYYVQQHFKECPTLKALLLIEKER